jgi:hypothetical protein
LKTQKTTAEVALETFCEIARRHECLVEPFLLSHNTESLVKVWIEDMLCIIYTAQGAHLAHFDGASDRKYFQVGFDRKRLMNSEFCAVVVLQEDPIVFFVPAIKIILSYQKQQGRIQVKIPEKSGLPVYRNRVAQMDWWEYHNAFHLAKQSPGV